MSKVAALLAGLLVATAGTGAALGSTGAVAAKVKHVMIVHQQNGCHSWISSGKTSVALTFAVKRGTKLAITNNDIDAHRLVQLAGPKVHLPGAMMMGHGGVVVFAKAGVYKFVTKVVEMAGMPEVKTTGPDHVLRLTVKVS